MTTDVGRVADATGLSSPTEPSCTVSALTGFDPSRLRKLAVEFVRNADEFARLSERPNSYGSGTDFASADGALFNLEQAQRCERLAYAIEYAIKEAGDARDA